MPWRLDPKFSDSSQKDGKDVSSKNSSSSSGLDMSKLPKRLQKQVNAALTKYDAQGKSPGPPNSGGSGTNVRKSDRFDEYAKKVGNCPECKQQHTYISRSNQLFVA